MSSSVQSSIFPIAFALLGTISSAQFAFADDGGISFGGSPHLLSGHPSVSMQSEVVRMDIHDELIKVDCHFVFHNSSNAPATVRVGFPDEGLGAEEPYQGEPLPPLSKLKATFLTYDSYVNGKKVPTKLVPTKDRGLFWHTKTVTFAPNKDCLIRDVYTLRPGGQVTSENGTYKQTSYVLHTGSSWKGPIGSAEIIVTFAPDALKTPVTLKPVTDFKNDPATLEWSKLPKNTMLWSGPCKPTLSGSTLTFKTSKLKPTVKDDIKLFYSFHKNTNM
ncbi:MAG TPA: DUF4424 family protein [Drouetiella sp.]